MYEAVIGLEIHAQLLTRSKIFCGCSTAFGSRPNTHVCPVCLGLPGALPVLNSCAVDLALRAALALGCEIQPTSVFARKNYFYPDLPKGYQISQYDRPLATGGCLEWSARAATRRIGLIRLHMEEDAGKSVHDEAASGTCVDFNRSGVPLIEIVTKPELRSAAEAAEFFERLRAVLVTIGVNDGNMEEGSLRCDANVSVRPAGDSALATKTELKNLNSFRFLEKALEHEISRQTGLLESGEAVVHETRLWDVAAGMTVAMRSKEEAHDYRYFPEPDLPPLVISRERIEAARSLIPELPEARKQRLMRDHGLPEQDAGVLTETPRLADYFEATAARTANPRAASNWILGEVLRFLKEHSTDITRFPVSPGRLAELVSLTEEGTISATVGKEVLARMQVSADTAREIVAREGLAQISDEQALVAIVRRVMEEHPGPVAQYRAGRTKTFGFIVGQAMKATGGKANPSLLGELLKKALEE